MKFNSILFAFLFLVTGSVYGQEGHNIEFEISGYENDSLVVGYYFGNRSLAKDTLLVNKKGNFILEGKDTLDEGIYLMLTRPNNKFLQFMVNKKDQHFKVETNIENLTNVNFKGSKDNEMFYDYLKYLDSKRPIAEQLGSEMKVLKEKGKDYSKIQRKLDDIDVDVKEYQDNIVKNHSYSITALMIQGNNNIVVPDFEGEKEEQRQAQYNYLKEHYFDNLALDNPAILRTPFLHSKIEYYLEKLTVQQPDSIYQSITRILNKMKPAEATFRFYLSYFLNDAANSKVVGRDAIYVNLIDDYYSKGKAPWIKDETKRKLIKNANKIRPSLIGKTVEDITLFKQDGSPFKLSDVETDYTVIMFWAPDCGHCKKAMPAAIEFNEEFKDKGVTFLAICTKAGDKYKTCWEVLEEKNMMGFVNLGDEFQRSRFKRKFDVTTTPKIFILDKNREILMKNIGSGQLKEVMEQIISNDSN